MLGICCVLATSVRPIPLAQLPALPSGGAGVVWVDELGYTTTGHLQRGLLLKCKMLILLWSKMGARLSLIKCGYMYTTASHIDNGTIFGIGCVQLYITTTPSWVNRTNHTLHSPPPWTCSEGSVLCGHLLQVWKTWGPTNLEDPFNKVLQILIMGSTSSRKHEM